MPTDPPFPRLFEPLTLRGTTLANRIVSSGHDTVMVDHGQVTDQLVAYHRARAAGGVGLIIVQVAGVHETARYTSHVLMATDDSCIDGYRRLVDAVAPYGTVLFGQLFHPGREVMESQDGSLPVAVAPSSVPNERFHVMPRALALDEVAEIVDGYVAAARRLRAAGLHGRRGRGQPRVPALPVPQPGGQPAHRPLRRVGREPTALPARRPGGGAGRGRRRHGGGPADLRRRAGPVGPAGADRTRRLPVAGRTGTRRLPQRHDGHVGVTGRLRPHRAGDVVRQRLHRAPRPSGPRGGRCAGHRGRTDQPAPGSGAPAGRRWRRRRA